MAIFFAVSFFIQMLLTVFFATRRAWGWTIWCGFFTVWNAFFFFHNLAK